MMPKLRSQIARKSIRRSQEIGLEHVDPSIVVRALYEADSSKEITLLAGNGTEVKCHHCVILAHSSLLLSMVSAGNTIVMQGASAEVLNLFVRYLYCFELRIEEMTCKVAVQLCKVAHRYGVLKLQSTMIQQINQVVAMDWYLVNDIMELYIQIKDIDNLDRFELLVLMSRLGDDKIRACQVYQGMDAREADDLHKKLQDANHIFGL